MIEILRLNQNREKKLYLINKYINVSLKTVKDKYKILTCCNIAF